MSIVQWALVSDCSPYGNYPKATNFLAIVVSYNRMASKTDVSHVCPHIGHFLLHVWNLQINDYKLYTLACTMEILPRE